MQNPTLDEIIKAWHHRTQQDSPLKMDSFCTQAIRLLAEGQPVSAGQLATTSQLSPAEVDDSLSQLNKCGCEFDDTGSLVGAVLSLNPTSHQFQVNGRALFAWCALDTLFLPALLGQSAHVESTCPTTGTRIRLTVTPEGIEALDPSDTVLSMVIPGVTPQCNPGSQSGPQGPLCSAIYFFSSREAASTWLVAHPGTAILSAEEAWQLAREVWIEPFLEHH
jgi:alkylmercury lyase